MFLCRVCLQFCEKTAMHWYNAQFCLHWGRCCTAPNELPNAGPGDAPKGASPGPWRRPQWMFLCRVCLLFCEKNAMHWFNAQFSLHWGRCCTAPNELPNAGPGDAERRWAGRCFCRMCLQFCEKNAMHCCNTQFSLHWGRCCLCRTLGRAMAASPGLGGGLNGCICAVFCLQFCEKIAMHWYNAQFCLHWGRCSNPPPSIAERWACAERRVAGLGGGLNGCFCAVCLQFCEKNSDWFNAQFSLHWGRCCTAPNELPNAGPGDVPKGASPGLGGGLNGCFCAVCACNSVKKLRCIV